MREFGSKIEERMKQRMERIQQRRYGSGNIWIGIFLLIIGGAALLKAMLLPIPGWVFTWQMLLIALGFFSGIRNNFSGGFWFILMLVGGIFLIDEFFPHLIVKEYLWPIALIVLGLFFVFRPRRRNWRWHEYKTVSSAEKTAGNFDDSAYYNDFINSTSIFSGTKKDIVSKNFKGGEIVNVFGGCEVDLTQADFNGQVSLELTQVFGGTKLIVPSNWQVKNEISVILGGIEDKRTAQNVAADTGKVLLLHGISVFGGIEIKSF